MSERIEIHQNFLWRDHAIGHAFRVCTDDRPDPWAGVDLRDWPGCLAFSLHMAGLWQRIMEMPEPFDTESATLRGRLRLPSQTTEDA